MIKSYNHSQQLPPHIIGYQNENINHNRKYSCEFDGKKFERKRLMSTR